MDEATRILIVEDAAADAELAEREINSNLKSCDFLVVETEKEFLDALERFRPDIIVSDYSLPTFDGMKALKISRDKTPATPLIILTGSQNEDIAVGCIKAGAADYVLKDSIKRLGPAVAGALEVRRVRLEKERVEAALRENEQRYRIITENMRDTIWIMDMDFRTTYISPSVVTARGFTLEELQEMPLEKHLTPQSLKTTLDVAAKELTPERLADPSLTISWTSDYEYYRKDGSSFWSEITLTLIRDADGRPEGFLGVGRDITERREAERALRESEERYRDLLDLAPVGIAVQSEGKVVFTNAAGARIIGAGSPEEITGLDISEIIHPDHLGEAGERIRRMMQGEQGLYPAENVYVKRDGTPVPVDVIATPINYRGKPAVQIIVTDISKRKEAEKAITESQERYRDLVENIADIVYITDGTGQIIYLNEALERVSGYTRDELLRKNYMELLTPEALEKVTKLFKTQKKGGEIGAYEVSFVDKNGKIKIIEVREQLIWEGKRIVQFRGIGRDVTERKRSEERIAHLNRVLESIRNIDQLIVRVKGRETLLTGACEILCEVSGYYFVWIGLIREEDKRVRPAAYWGFEDGYLKDITVTWDDTPTGRGPMGTAIRTKRACVFNDTADNPDFQPWRDESLKRGYRSLIAVPVIIGGRVYGALGVYSSRANVFDDEEVTLLEEVAEDIAFALSAIEAETERERSEKALKDSEEKFRDFFETSRDIVFITSLDGSILDTNSVFEEILGYTREEALTKNVTFFYKEPQDRDRFRDAIDSLGSVRDLDMTLRRKDGAYIDCLITATVRRDQDGTIIGYQGTIRDVSEKKQMERQLIRAEKLSSLGGILSGVAHEMNNPLTSIIGISQMIMRGPIPEALREKLEVIHRESFRTSKIIQGLLAFAREHKPERKMISINKIIEESYRLREYEFRVDNVAMKLELSPDIPFTAADPYQLQQVFVNLINNGHDALANGGGSLLIIRSLHRDDAIVMEFEDDGPGIPEKDIGFIFDPFFTTKEVGKGTGLGLSIVYGIINEHGGKIEVASPPGKGAVFTIYLPVIKEIPETAAPIKTRAVKQKSEKTVLVVEDEESLRLMLGEALEQDGYRVHLSEGGQQAIEAMKIKRFDGIITDLKMPGIGGKELYTFVQKYYPDVAGRVLFITGDVLGKDTQGFLKITGNIYLEKPFEIEALLGKLGEALER